MTIICPVAVECQKALADHREAFIELSKALDRPGYIVAAAKGIEESFGRWIESVVALTPDDCRDCRSVKLAQAMGVRVEC